MQTITDRAALRRAIRDPALDPHLRAVLRLRHDQLGGAGACFYVVQPHDRIADAEAAIGFPLTDEGEPCWEWLQRHPGGWCEVVFVLSDDGPAQVLLVPGDADASITAVLREHADG
jgi:hypothetical protein